MDTRVAELDELLDRLVAIQEEIGQRAKAKRVMWYQQSGFPYWTNRLARIEPVQHFGGDVWQFQVDVEMRYHAGAFTEGADSDLEQRLQGFIAFTLAVFKQREGLESRAFPDEMNALMVGSDNISIVSRGIGTIPTGSTSFAKGSTFDLQVFITLSTEDF